VIDTYKKIIRAGGILSLWQGVIPNCARNAVINTAELASYDQIKETVLKYKLLKDNFYCYFVSSACAGFIAVMVGSPIDVIKTRIMNA